MEERAMAGQETLLQRIVIDPDVMAGKPIIRGTRIPVDLIIRLLGQPLTVPDLLADYPHLTAEDVQAALLYSADCMRHEDIFPLIV
jgi:uncharacterized protein (DUF433 family)